MLIIEVKNPALEQEIDELLNRQFDGDVEHMMQQLLSAFAAYRERIKYSGILAWPSDALAYQREVRDEWR